MNCMKCGREIAHGQIFCDACLTEMKDYPVKPDTAVQLPPSAFEPQVKKQLQHRRPVLTAEEQIARLRRRNRGLLTALLVALVVITTLCFASVAMLAKLDVQNLLGKNYNTITSTQPTAMPNTVP